MAEILLFNKLFPIVDTCLNCEDNARQSCAMVSRWRIFGDFLGPAFPASHVQHISGTYIRQGGDHVGHWPTFLVVIMAALCNRGAIIFLPCSFFLLLSFYLFSSPNLSGRRLDVCHTSTHGVALVRI